MRKNATNKREDGLEKEKLILMNDKQFSLNEYKAEDIAEISGFLLDEDIISSANKNKKGPKMKSILIDKGKVLLSIHRRARYIKENLQVIVYILEFEGGKDVVRNDYELYFSNKEPDLRAVTLNGKAISQAEMTKFVNIVIDSARYAKKDKLKCLRYLEELDKLNRR